MSMNHHTPKKRKLTHVPAAEPESEEESRPELDEIDWQEEELEIGPTPQVNGRIIGLFDTLSPEKTIRESMAPPPELQRSSKSPLKTPAYLRNQVITIEDSTTPRLLFPAPPKRGLSLLITELREMEDAAEDEGMQVLREMEADFPRINQMPTVPVETAQPAEVSEKVKWKKKGLKRTHRRVIMRPNAVKKSRGTALVDEEVEEDNGEQSDEYINSEDEAADARAALGGNNETQAAVKVVEQGKKAGGISQNYKSLKLRNTGAKGGSRFGRGRFGGGGGRR